MANGGAASKPVPRGHEQLVHVTLVCAYRVDVLEVHAHVPQDGGWQLDGGALPGALGRWERARGELAP